MSEPERDDEQVAQEAAAARPDAPRPPDPASDAGAEAFSGLAGEAGAASDDEAFTGVAGEARSLDEGDEIASAGDAEAVAAEPDPEAELRALADKYLDLAQRTQADFDNYRKRMAREVRAAEARGIGKLARELLPALDNLERALAAVESSDPDHHLSAGIRLVTAELAAALGRSGIEGYSPIGELFDPAQHEAVAQQPFDGAEAGTVGAVLQSGYRLNESILRPARVIVAS